MELKRTFYDVLLAWKADKRGQCLLVNGARQVGKTFLIEKFGRENYESFIEINFALEPEFADVFEGALDARSIRERLTAMRGDVRIVPGRTLLFLDEIQECPDARTAFKPLALDGTFDVIASGSLLGIKYKKGRRGNAPRSIPVGFEREVVMHSLSFAEYLAAKGFEGESLDLVKRCFERREPVPDAVNERFHALFREYAVVGGMPTVASAFLERGHYGEVQSLQEALVADHVADIRNTRTRRTFRRSRPVSAPFPGFWRRRTKSSNTRRSRIGERPENTSRASSGSEMRDWQRSPSASARRCRDFPAT